VLVSALDRSARLGGGVAVLAVVAPLPPSRTPLPHLGSVVLMVEVVVVVVVGGASRWPMTIS
jgi:hypothetical protein